MPPIGGLLAGPDYTATTPGASRRQVASPALKHVRHYETVDTTIANTLLGSGSLAAGQIVAGDIAFQVPANETRFTLLWTPDILSDSITVPIT